MWTADATHEISASDTKLLRFVTTSNPLKVVTKRGYLAKNDTERRPVSKSDTWAVYPPKNDTRQKHYVYHSSNDETGDENWTNCNLTTPSK